VYICYVHFDVFTIITAVMKKKLLNNWW